MAEPSLQLGNGNWAGKSDNLLAYHKANNNFYADELTFARASTGTIVNADGLIESVASGMPRVDYLNNSNGSLLLESQRTNKLTTSSDFSSYTKSGTIATTANYGVSPSGQTDSTRVVFSSSNNAFYKLSVHSGNTETNTIYIKGTSGETIKFGKGATVNGGDIFTLNGEWQRLNFVSTTGNQFTINTYSTVTARDIEIWGAQVEEGSYSTSYIPTSGTTVTRLADASSTTGLSSVIGQTEGTMYIDFTYKGLEDVNNMTSLSDGGVSNRVQLNISSSGIGALIVSNGVTSFTSSNTSLVVGNRYKVAVKYKVNDFALWINGTETSTDTLGDVPLNLNRFSFAFTNGTAFHFNQTVSASLLYKTALTDTELATLTTI